MDNGITKFTTIGIVVAIKQERAPFSAYFGDPDYIYDDDTGYEVSTWLSANGHRIYLVLSGYGEIAAAAATQYLIDQFCVDCIINYGVAGGLKDEHFIKKVGLVRKIVHYGFDLSAGGYDVGRYPEEKDLFLTPNEDALPEDAFMEYPEFVCASADKYVDKGWPKKKLRKLYGADVCEMESAGIVMTCNRNKVPCSFIKAVSDGVNDGEEVFEANASDAVKSCIEVLARFLS